MNKQTRNKAYPKEFREQVVKLVQADGQNLFREHGLPERLRSDNGTPFASTGAGRLSRLSGWWIKLGIAVE